MQGCSQVLVVQAHCTKLHKMFYAAPGAIEMVPLKWAGGPQDVAGVVAFR
jgi:hypothetical protein